MHLHFILFLMLTASLSFAQDRTIELEPNLNISIGEDYVHVAGEAGKVILLDFWASWCGPCRESFPWMNKIQAKYSEQGLKVLAINLDQSNKEARAFLRIYPAEFQIAFDPDGLLAEAISVAGMPTSFLIDREGKIIEQFVGFSPKRAQKHEQRLEKALAEKSNKPAEPIAMNQKKI